MGSSVLLSMLNSSKLVPTIPALGVHGPVTKKMEGPNRCEKLPPDSSDFDDREGLGKTYCQPPVMVA